MVNGVIERDGVLWIASLGGELVAADAATGEILGRFGPNEGIATPPDDLVMTDDGTIYWTGWLTGEIGALSPATGRSRTVANIGTGANPIALAPDGALVVGRAYLSKGVVRVDPATGAVRTLNPDVAVNSFAIGPDGALYAPRTDTIPAQVVRIDPTSGQTTTVSADIGAAAAALKFPPPARGEAPTTAYVLAGMPIVVRRLDVQTGQRLGGDRSVPFPVVDNLNFAPDGTLYITANIGADVLVMAGDGRTRTMTIGRR